MAVRNLSANATEGADEYTIDQLAQASGVTVRNIRAHQSRGLLPPPEVRGRTGFYTREHLDRLRLIAEMQADGFNLNSIKRILDNLPAGSAGQVLGFEQAIRQPWADEEPEVIEGSTALAGAEGDEGLLKKAIKLGLLIPLGEDRYEVPSPSLLRAGPELDRLGVDLATRLAVLERVQKHTDGVAASFIDLFVAHIWKPFHDAGRPDEDWPQVHDALQRLRPMATEVLLATFGQAMSRGVGEAFGKALEESVRVPSRKPADAPRPDSRRARRTARKAPGPRRRSH
ncbi:MAG: MerR family transcriptional regulator [Candidatus Dormibacteraeota bacterium]|nr:MerR family transcriptional regulator [Candidatus Dormibacteraeota bacterium]